QGAQDVFPVFRLAGRDGEAAVAGHHRGDPVPAGGSRQRVPGELRVHVRVDVDEARGHNLAVGVHRPGGRAADFPDFDNPALFDSHVPGERGPPGTVNDPAVLNEKVICHGVLLFRPVPPDEVRRRASSPGCASSVSANRECMSLRGAAGDEAISFTDKDCFAPLAMTPDAAFAGTLFNLANVITAAPRLTRILCRPSSWPADR